MKRTIRLHFLSFLLSALSFISCNSTHLDRSNMDGNDHKGNEQHIGSSFNRSSSQVVPSTQSNYECMNRFINKFMNDIIQRFINLIKLNANDNDLVHQSEQVIRQLYDSFSSGYKKFYFTKRDFKEPANSAYTEFGKKFFKISSIDPDFRFAFIYLSYHIWRNQYLKDNFQQAYNDSRLSNDYKLNKKLDQLMTSLFASIQRQIILEITYLLNQAHKNQMNQLGRAGDLSLSHQIVLQARKLIKEIIHLRFQNNEQYQKETTRILERSMDKYGLLKSAEAPDDTSIYQCMEDYFNRLKSRYYDPIQQKGDALFQSIETNIRLLSANEPNLILVKNSVNRLIHSICLYNGIRLLLHFYLSHNSMTLPLTSPNSANTDCIKRCADKIISSTYLADTYIALINLGREDSHLSSICCDLIKSCADMAKRSPEATK